MLDGFNAFGDDFKVKCNRLPQDGLQNGLVLAIFDNLTHETLIDLKDVGGQVLEIGNRGVAGTEVVREKTAPDHAAGVEYRRDPGNVLKSAGLKDFEFQAEWLDQRMGRKQLGK